MKIYKGSINKVFKTAVSDLLESKSCIVKNDKTIKEIHPVVFKIENPKAGILSVEGRAYNPAFMVAETFWNLAGQDDYWLTNYNYKYKEYFDLSKKLKAGYGKRIFKWDNGKVNQINKIVNLLKRNPFSQHANISIFDPSYDLDEPKFVPCITMIKFKIRENKLHMSTYMRAQDIWIGFPYDVHMLLSIFQFVSKKLSIPMGDYYHYCDVLRLYEDDFHSAQKATLKEISGNNLIDIEQLDQSSLKKIISFLISPNLKDYNLLSKQVNPYIKNCLALGLLYVTVKEKRFDEKSNLILKDIENVWKKEFIDWKQKYYPNV